MRLEALLFRFRVWIFLSLYLLGFLLPWESSQLAPGTRPSTLWLASSTLLARTGWVGLASATLTVTCFALACLTIAALLRVWGTAYLGADVMRDQAMHGDRVVAAGPFRLVRNPLYLGSWLFAVGVSFLMAPLGALFFILAMSTVIFFLIRGEEHFLFSRMGSAYEQYRLAVPRWVPSPRRRIPSSGVRPRWAQSLIAEAVVVGFAVCFAVFAWRYNVHILLRCLLICAGAGLILRGALRGRRDAASPS